MPILTSNYALAHFTRPSPFLCQGAADRYNRSLPGSDPIAKKTGAIVIANGGAINLLRCAGVPEA